MLISRFPFFHIRPQFSSPHPSSLLSFRTVFTSLCFCGTFLLVACGDSDKADQIAPISDPALDQVARPLPPDAAPPDKQIFTYQNYEPASLDISVSVYQSGQSEFLFERLAMLDHDDELVPGAADRWESSPDGKTWTFYLRPGNKWSDGQPVTAYDFEYTFRRLLDPKSGNVYAFFYYDIKNARAFNQGKITNIEDLGVRALDELTFVIETEEVCAYLPYVVQFPTSSPVPRWQVEKYDVRWTEEGRCVSNGAFKLDTWRAGREMSFGLNPYYSGPNRAYLRRIVRRFTGPVGATSAAGGIGITAYENNEIDWITVDKPADLDRIKKDPQLSKELYSYDGFATNYLFFRTRQPPFDDLRVRQAIAHAVDQEAIANVVLQKTVIPAYTMLPPHFPGYVGDKHQVYQQYDPDRARQLLADAGYPNGRGFPNVDMWIADAGPESLVGQAAQVIQQQLKEILKIQIDIRNTQGNTYFQRMYQWEIPMSLGGFGYDFPDPQSLLGVVWRSQPKGFTRHDWRNDRFDELIDKAARELDHDTRFGYYDEAEQALASDVGGAFLWHRLAHDLRKPWIKGIKQDQWGNYPFKGNNTTYYEMYIGQER